MSPSVTSTSKLPSPIFNFVPLNVKSALSINSPSTPTTTILVSVKFSINTDPDNVVVPLTVKSPGNVILSTLIPSNSRLLIYAVPLTYKSFHAFSDEPMSNVLLSLGTIDELILLVNTTMSSMELSPIKILPPSFTSPVKLIDPVCIVLPVMFKLPLIDVSPPTNKFCSNCVFPETFSDDADTKPSKEALLPVNVVIVTFDIVFPSILPTKFMAILPSLFNINRVLPPVE